MSYTVIRVIVVGVPVTLVSNTVIIIIVVEAPVTLTLKAPRYDGRIQGSHYCVKSPGVRSHRRSKAVTSCTEVLICVAHHVLKWVLIFLAHVLKWTLICAVILLDVQKWLLVYVVNDKMIKRQWFVGRYCAAQSHHNYMDWNGPFASLYTLGHHLCCRRKKVLYEKGLLVWRPKTWNTCLPTLAVASQWAVISF